jgi:hypothetical protein
MFDADDWPRERSNLGEAGKTNDPSTSEGAEVGA